MFESRSVGEVQYRSHTCVRPPMVHIYPHILRLQFDKNLHLSCPYNEERKILLNHME